jgi:protein-tyrosine phosphatase
MEIKGRIRKILFVCHGNICRSPMAEFVMKDELAKAGLTGVEVESAALHTDELGSDIHRGTRAILQKYEIPFSPREAWLLSATKASGYDIIIGMDAYNMADLKRLVYPDDRTKLVKMLELAGQSRDVADPWYTGNFEDTYRDVLAGCRSLIGEIKARDGE